LLSKSMILPQQGINWVSWRLTSEDHRMLEMACTSPALFDLLLNRISEIPEPSFPGQFLWYPDTPKDCPLGEDYVETLADRLLKEGRPKHRIVLRDAIQWHAFHVHSEKSARKPYEESVAARIRTFDRHSAEDDRWYGVVQAIYAPLFPEACAEMWRAIRADAQKTDGALAIGAFETAFNRLNKGFWTFRKQFLKECLRFIEEARDQENPASAGWLLNHVFQNYVRHGPNLQTGEVFEWEAALAESALKARSQAHRGDSIRVLLAMKSPRAVSMLNAWLSQDLTDLLIERFVRDSGGGQAFEGVSVADIINPRVRAWLTIQREVRTRSWGSEGTAVAYLFETLKTDPNPDMRREAVHALAYNLRDDDRDNRDDLPQGMSNRLDLLEVVLADVSPEVRRVLAEILKRDEECLPKLNSNRREQIRKLFDSVK